MKHLRRRIREWAKENKRSDISCLRKAKFWIENGICEPEFDVIIERLLQSIKFGRAITRERMIVDYGDVIKMKSLIDNRYINHYNVVWEYDEWSDDEIKRKLNEYRILQ